MRQEDSHSSLFTIYFDNKNQYHNYAKTLEEKRECQITRNFIRIGQKMLEIAIQGLTNDRYVCLYFNGLSLLGIGEAFQSQRLLRTY